MAHFMAKMADQRTIRLTHGGTNLLAFSVVSFFDVDRDDAIVVTGQHTRTVPRRS